MTLLNEVINITITQIKGNTTTNDFNSVLVLLDEVPLEGFGAETVVKQYTSLQDVYTDFPENGEARAIAAKIFSQPYVPSKILIATTRNEEDVSFTDLYAAVKSIRDDFKFIISSADELATILEVSELAEADKKIYGVTVSYPNIITEVNNDLLSQLKGLNRTRTFLFYTQTVDGIREFYIEAALISYMCQYEVGSATWAYKQLVNVRPSFLTDVSRSHLESKNGNFFTTFARKNCTFYGVLTDGGYIDVRIGIDWLDQTIKENLASLLTDQGVGKIPYTQEGIDLVANNLRASLQQAVDRSIINPDFKIITPDYFSVSLADKTARVLNNVSFEATFTGAIHKVAIRGTISY